MQELKKQNTRNSKNPTTYRSVAEKRLGPTISCIDARTGISENIDVGFQAELVTHEVTADCIDATHRRRAV